MPERLSKDMFDSYDEYYFEPDKLENQTSIRLHTVLCESSRNGRENCFPGVWNYQP
jgi:hypothetical protein